MKQHTFQRSQKRPFSPSVHPLPPVFSSCNCNKVSTHWLMDFRQVNLWLGKQTEANSFTAACPSARLSSSPHPPPGCPSPSVCHYSGTLDQCSQAWWNWTQNNKRNLYLPASNNSTWRTCWQHLHTSIRRFTVLIMGHSHLDHCPVPHFILPGASVVRIFSVFSLLRLSVGAQHSINPSFPAVGPAGWSIPPAKAPTK